MSPPCKPGRGPAGAPGEAPALSAARHGRIGWMARTGPAARSFALAVLPILALRLAAGVVPATSPAGVDAPGEPHAPASQAADSPAPDVAALVHEAQRVQQADAAAWRQFRFSRGVRLERLGAEGRTLGVEETLSEVTPVEEGFDERLLRINGREPTPDEVATFREKEPFARHYRTLRAGGAESEEEGGYSLATLLRLSSYRYAGREWIGGTECHRLDFSPDPDRPKDSLAARVAGAMAGRLWLTVDGAHLIRARATSVRPVPLTLGLFSVRSLDLDLEATEVAGGTWLPGRLTIVSDVRIILVGQIRRRVITYSDYARVAEKETASRVESLPS